jgi:hypothetical protein
METVRGEEGSPEDLRQLAAREAPLQLELEEAFAGGEKALRAQRVTDGRGRRTRPTPWRKDRESSEKEKKGDFFE